jgi:anti-sigma B factor antagonist
MSMNYTIRQMGDVTVLDLSGRVSLGEAIASSPSSGLVLHDLVRQEVKDGNNKILLNLCEVAYVDSSGLGEFVSSLGTVRDYGGQLRICNASGRVGDLLRMTHLDSVLKFDKDEATALQAVLR